ncbi:(2Fe-2S)-binding protein [Roseisalinus antarcticus]|uniref:6-hydroxypseudooxynicotine dehydrogenase complex subunit beta n=1 Tax=Roseisalinus antarcticus TaxID=254357 RepID=A0A1Y5TZU3_9RHOB|nr:(2Fe-2S)-binding protein [Roseisalinus antarcticus]SLN75540.1 6-hydroxypseudooxynicotine dehydrogenase complex subunit beta [Roseisalinus antarcticus]
MTEISVTLNGVETTVAIEDRTSLADMLRERLDQTGTRLGCEHGGCGACAVLLDGMPVRSCIVLAAMADGARVETLEGLLEDPIIAALSKTFHELHALQCGFCTSGMLVTARDILRRHSAPTRDTIRKELSGQICRCTGYVGIVNAIEAAGRDLASNEADKGTETAAP